MRSAITALLFSTMIAACSGSTDTRADCTEGHCDTPGGGTVAEQCANSRSTAMDEKRPHFTAQGVRWSCKDVNGVTANSNTSDDRGQEYCEYFTMLHTDGVPNIISDSSGPVFCDDMTPCSTGVCDTSIFSCVSANEVDTTKAADLLGKNTRGATVTPLDPKLSNGQLDWLAQHPDSKVGECVFTSWHKDITNMPTSNETIGGYPLTAKTPGGSEPLFRMDVGFNSNGAAQALVNDCIGATSDPKITDGYTRACTECGDLSCVPWRKSDPSVCTMAMRIAECGCTVNIKDGSGGSRALDLAKEDDLALAKELFVPTTRRGFTLGTWDGMGQLPVGCRYVRTGDSATVSVNGASFEDPNADQQIVACDLKGSMITAQTAKDPKEACRQSYGDDVVVHVRAPDPALATLSCDTTKPKCEGAPWNFSNI